MSDKRANPAMPKSLPMGALEIKGAWQHREIWSIALQAIVGGEISSMPSYSYFEIGIGASQRQHAISHSFERNVRRTGV